MKVCHAGAMSDQHTPTEDDFEDVIAGDDEPTVDDYQLSTRPSDPNGGTAVSS